MSDMPKINPAIMGTAKDLECEKCKSIYFNSVMQIKIVSAIVSPSGKEMHVPIETFACSKCGHVNDQFVPKF